jgi:hypothetical protein
MPTRRLNYTGRQRIARGDVRITACERTGHPPTFGAALRLQRYRLPEDALVCVEAYRQTRWMRFDFGTVGGIVPPLDRALTEFDSLDQVLFRVKVTCASGDRQGMLLAEADQIPIRRPEDSDEERIPLFPVAPGDLGDEVYRVDFSDGHPTLLVNREVGDWPQVAQSPPFRSLVYSAALRQILTRILCIEGTGDTDDEDDWRGRWLRFASGMSGVGDVPDPEDRDACEVWIDTAVAAFARQFQMTEQFRAFWRGGE